MASFNDMWSSMNTADDRFSDKMTRCVTSHTAPATQHQPHLYRPSLCLLSEAPPPRSWTTSPGYPLVSVTSASNNRIILSAKPYTPALYPTTPPVWWIPVNYTVSTADAPVPVTVRTSFMSNAQVCVSCCVYIMLCVHEQRAAGDYTVGGGQLVASECGRIWSVSHCVSACVMCDV